LLSYLLVRFDFRQTVLVPEVLVDCLAGVFPGREPPCGEMLGQLALVEVDLDKPVGVGSTEVDLVILEFDYF